LTLKGLAIDGTVHDKEQHIVSIIKQIFGFHGDYQLELEGEARMENCAALLLLIVIKAPASLITEGLTCHLFLHPRLNAARNVIERIGIIDDNKCRDFEVSKSQRLPRL
jgi:hypothetical protein